MRIISFSGSQGAGKDAAVQFVSHNLWLLANRNSRAIHLKFAEPLQDLVAVLMGIYKPDFSHRLNFNDRDWKENSQHLIGDKVYNPRKLLQLMGTDCVRNQINEQVWVQHLVKRIKQVPKEKGVQDVFLISDLRFKGELESLKKEFKGNYYSVYLEADTQRSEDTHSSELDLPFVKANCHKVIENKFDEKFFKSLETVIFGVL